MARMKKLLSIPAFLLCISGVQAATTLYETQFRQTAINVDSDFLDGASVSLTNPSTSLSGNLAADLLVPNVQMQNNNAGWTVTFSFTATQDIIISSLNLGFQFVTGTGTRHGNTDSKTGTATVTLAAGDSSATADLSFERVQADKNGTPTADIQQASFNTPVTVKAGETFTLTVNAKHPHRGHLPGAFPTGPPRGRSAGTGHSLPRTARTGRPAPAPPRISGSII